MTPISKRSPALAFLAIALVAACDDVTIPKSTTHPLVGTWDVTARLDTFLYEFPNSPRPPECSLTELYCRISRPTLGATLTGVLVIPDSLIGGGQPSGDSLNVRLPAHGTFEGFGCTSIDFDRGTGCLRMGEIDGTYSLGFASVFASDSTWTFTRIPGEYTPSVSLVGRLPAGDVMTGRVEWQLSVGRTPPQYRGTFVARRRR
jgi:hypothetical protein